MSYASWTFYKSNAAHLCAIDASTPLVGAGSLHMSNAAATNVSSITHGVYTASHGFTAGKIRSLLRAQGGGSLPNGLYGFFCMQSQADLSSTSGSAYWGGVRIHGTGQIDCYAQLRKTTAGGLGLGNGDTAQATGSDMALFTPPNTTVAVQLEWQYHTSLGPGVQLVLSFGLAEDFSDLEEILNYTDTSSPLATAAAEGLAFRKVGTFADTHQVRWDRTRVVPRF
jgi:hypothetical protein